MKGKTMKGPDRFTRRGFALRAIPAAIILFVALWPISQQESVQLIMPMTAMAAFAYYMWAGWGRLRDMGVNEGYLVWTAAPVIEAAITTSIMAPMRPGDQIIGSVSMLFMIWALAGFFYLLLRPGTLGVNKYGEDPRPIAEAEDKMFYQEINFGPADGDEDYMPKAISLGKLETKTRSLRLGTEDDQ